MAAEAALAAVSAAEEAWDAEDESRMLCSHSGARVAREKEIEAARLVYEATIATAAAEDAGDIEEGKGRGNGAGEKVCARCGALARARVAREKKIEAARLLYEGAVAAAAAAEEEANAAAAAAKEEAMRAAEEALEKGEEGKPVCARSGALARARAAREKKVREMKAEAARLAHEAARAAAEAEKAAAAALSAQTPDAAPAAKP